MSISYIDYTQEEQELQTEYQEELAAMDTMSADTALIYCMTVLLPTVSEWYELQMMELSQVLDELTEMQSDLNTIQSVFNDAEELADLYNESFGTSEFWSAFDDYEWEVQKAINAANDIQLIINNDPAFASIADDVNQQLDTIFSCDESGLSHLYDVTMQWVSMWGDVESKDTNTSEAGTDLMQSINDAFDALATDFSNVSSSTQSELQYYESCDQQIQGLIDDMQDEWMDQLAAMTRNQIAS